MSILKKCIVLSLLCLLLQGCTKCKGESMFDFYVINHSNEKIHLGTTVLINEPIVLHEPEETIPPYGVHKISTYDINDNHIKLWIIIYKDSTIQNHSWEDIVEQRLYDALYSYTYEELEAANFEIVYHGDDES